MMQLSRRHFLGASALAAAGVAPVLSGPAHSAGVGAEYTNPARGDFGPVFPDPSVIRGRDGFWYAYATAAIPAADPRRHNLPIVRSADLAAWEYVGDVFDASNFPDWLDPARDMWAPEVDYFDGRYLVYYTALDSPAFERPNRSIGVATAPTPAGPWTDAGGPVVLPTWWEPFPGQRQFAGTIDPEVVTTPEGRRYIYSGGYNGGLFVAELSTDGLVTVADPVQIAPPDRYEAAYVVHRDGWYYLFVSTANCCSGPVSGYSVYVLRARTPEGPFVDRNGAPMLSARPGGTPVLTQSGNTWLGTGHNAILTDLAGGDHIMYHAYDRDDPYVSGPVPLKRMLLLDRLDWIDGWPTTRAGVGPSDQPEPAPVVTGIIADAFEGVRTGLGDAWIASPGWSLQHEPAGGYLSAGSHAGERTLYTRRAVAGALRVRATFRFPDGESDGAGGFVLADRRNGGSIRITIDRTARALVVGARLASNAPETVKAPLHPGFAYEDWHQLDVRLRGRTLRVEVSNAGLYDPVAVLDVQLPAALDNGRIGLLSVAGPTDVDDVSVAQLFQPATRAHPDPQPGVLDPAYGDEFDRLDEAWQWIREPAGAVTAGRLEFPLQARDLTPGRRDASLLARPAPPGNAEWMVETKLRLPFAEAQPAGFPKAGIFVYVRDDLFLGLVHVAHAGIRRTDFVKQMPYDTNVLAGAAWIGPPGEQDTFLRLHHTANKAGEHIVRAGTSPDAQDWTWGAAYTLPAGAELKIALGAYSSFAEEFTATFEYVRAYRR